MSENNSNGQDVHRKDVAAYIILISGVIATFVYVQVESDLYGARYWFGIVGPVLNVIALVLFSIELRNRRRHKE